VSPAPSAGASASGAVTPVASVASIEAVKDVLPVPGVSYDVGIGEILHDYEIFQPNYGKSQLYARVCEVVSKGVEGTPAADSGASRIVEFYDTLYDKLVQKGVIRDGYRHLPDTQTVKVAEAYCFVWITAVNNIEKVLQVINNFNWNDFTRSQRTIWSGLFRRASEAYNALKTFEMPDLYRALALSNPIMSDAPGGPLMITFLHCQTALRLLVADGGDHPAFLPDEWDDNGATDYEGMTRDFFLQILDDVNNSIALLRFQPSSTFVALDGGTCDTTWQTNAQNDLKYFVTLIHEIVYPMGLPEVRDVVVNKARFQQILYVEALYMVDDDTHFVGYPSINKAENGMVYRTFLDDPKDILRLSGFGEVWAVNVAAAATAFYGTFIQQIRAGGTGSPRGKDMWMRWDNINGLWLDSATHDMSDAADIKALFINGNPITDHVWNECIFLYRSFDPVNLHWDKPCMGFFMKYSTPMELMRAALCTTWNVPYTR